MADQAGPEAEDHPLSPSGTPGPDDLAARLQALALARGVTVGTAESCTGGLIGSSITSVPGSSAYFEGGVISYSDAVKVAALGVPAGTIERHGAVSAQVAVAMAAGVRVRLGCDFGVSVTGVAGPDGGTTAKPVGLTYVAVAGPGHEEVRRYVWDGHRQANRVASAVAALQLLIEVLGQVAAREPARPNEPDAPGAPPVSDEPGS
jgi:PncC family amidohydrolase